MNKFIKLPLFLGSVCLIFCTTLAVVVNVCNPLIEKNTEKKEKEAYLNLYEGVTEDSIKKVEGEKANFDDYKQIVKLVTVEHNNVTSYVYSLKTKDPQSGTISFMLGIDNSTHKVDAYTMVSNNNSGYGSDFVNADKQESVLEGLISYGKGGEFYRTAGATKTQNVMKEAVNQAFVHYKANFMGGNN